MENILKLWTISDIMINDGVNMCMVHMFSVSMI